MTLELSIATTGCYSKQEPFTNYTMFAIAACAGSATAMDFMNSFAAALHGARHHL